MSGIFPKLFKMFGYNETNWKYVLSDWATRSLTFLDWNHHEIHEGDAYYIKNYGDIATNAVIDVRFTTPNTTKWSHVFPVVNTETEYLYHIYEDVAITVAGAAITPRNRDRNFNGGVPDQSSVVIDFIENASVALANDDTNLAGSIDLFPGITGSARKAGGEVRGDSEIVYRQNTIYCLRLVCVAAGWTDYTINWYEHANKDK